MKLPRTIGLVDIAMVIVLLAMVLLPPRRMYANGAIAGDEATQFAIAAAEARGIAHPGDGTNIVELARRLSDAGFKDWALEVAVDGAKTAKGSPTEWKALLAASAAYVDKLDVVPALDFANRALTTCRGMASGCPSWEDLRMSSYIQYLDAGIKSGIDPRLDAEGFRTAADKALPLHRIK